LHGIAEQCCPEQPVSPFAFETGYTDCRCPDIVKACVITVAQAKILEDILRLV
jgi:hypothetical protein